MARTILIIDDDVELCEIMRDRLEADGYKVIVAYTGIEGIASINSTAPNIISLDIHLPDMNGMEILKMLKKGIKHSLPIVIVTCDDTAKTECEKYGADGFITKPINFNKLKEIISTKL